MDVEVLNAFLAIHSPVHSTAYLTTPVLYRIWPRGVDFDPEASDADFLVEFDPDIDLPPLEQFFGLVYRNFHRRHGQRRLRCRCADAGCG